MLIAIGISDKCQHGIPRVFDTNMLVAADGTIPDILSAIISGSRTSVHMSPTCFDNNMLIAADGTIPDILSDNGSL